MFFNIRLIINVIRLSLRIKRARVSMTGGIMRARVSMTGGIMRARVSMTGGIRDQFSLSGYQGNLY